MYRNCMNNKCSCNSCPNDDGNYENACCNVANSMCEHNECACGFDEENTFPSNPMLAQSYVPWQNMNRTFVPCVGLKMGTIFPELVSPYVPGQSQEEFNYIRSRNAIGEGCNR